MLINIQVKSICHVFLMCMISAPALGIWCWPAQAEDKVWRHGVPEAKSDAGIIMMVGNGFAERERLKLELLQFKTDTIGLQALLSGNVESYEAGVEGAVLANAHGADVKIIGCQWPGLPHGIFVRSNIAKAQDLVGKTIAIAAPGGFAALMANALLQNYHISPHDVRFANLGNDLERYKALSVGLVDAAVISGEYRALPDGGSIRWLVAGRDLLPNYLRGCIMSSNAVLASRPDDAVRFLTAEMKALSFAISHRSEALDLTAQIVKRPKDDPRATFIYDDAIQTHAVDPQLNLPINKLDWLVQEMVKEGNLPHSIDVTQLVDGETRIRALAAASN